MHEYKGKGGIRRERGGQESHMNYRSGISFQLRSYNAMAVSQISCSGCDRKVLH